MHLPKPDKSQHFDNAVFLGQTIMLMDTEYLVTFMKKTHTQNKAFIFREHNHLVNAYRQFCDYFRYNNFNKEIHLLF